MSRRRLDYSNCFIAVLWSSLSARYGPVTCPTQCVFELETPNDFARVSGTSSDSSPALRLGSLDQGSRSDPFRAVLRSSVDLRLTPISAIGDATTGLQISSARRRLATASDALVLHFADSNCSIAVLWSNWGNSMLHKQCYGAIRGNSNCPISTAMEQFEVTQVLHKQCYGAVGGNGALEALFRLNAVGQTTARATINRIAAASNAVDYQFNADWVISQHAVLKQLYLFWVETRWIRGPCPKSNHGRCTVHAPSPTRFGWHSEPMQVWCTYLAPLTGLVERPKRTRSLRPFHVPPRTP